MARYLKDEMMCQTEKEFNTKIGAEPAIAVFTATWSKACRNDEMIDYLEGLPGRFDGAKFVYADVDQLESVAQDLGLRDRLPAVIFYREGKPKEWYYLSPENEKDEREKKIGSHILRHKTKKDEMDKKISNLIPRRKTKDEIDKKIKNVTPGYTSEKDDDISRGRIIISNFHDNNQEELEEIIIKNDKYRGPTRSERKFFPFPRIRLNFF